ncbi:gamma carbonic anhydrase family protein [Palleronia sediminis]|uniref:Gamma carbonic anhydrase family protein n=1 Tax=Palleronia sediminis TaxID=2547833 RepID=A0A4R6A426_9RHOB|nr:gamma carbonic anhydrase family protein [Palleronia sediminis]TDL78350.1 gamma carbonic anhydrase family protein [Palleronia sediminis]
MAVPIPALSAEYDGISPSLAGGSVAAGEGAAVLGRATLGAGARLGPFSVIRADGHYVEIGEGFHLGEHGTVHIEHEIYPTHIGHRVTAGAFAVIHACDVGDDCVIERGAVILDGAKIGSGAVITAGSVVFPRKVLEGGWIYAGVPARPVAPVSAAERDSHRDRVRAERPTGHATRRSATTLDGFVAPTARVTGDVVTGDGVGIWYGCILDAGAHRIEIGAGTNIQDNSILSCGTGDIVIGPEVTVGHNVTMSECRIEAKSLIGIGSILAPGTVVESDVLLAAGAHTEPGQRITAEQVWAGRPARPIAEMDERKRRILSATPPTYRAYAASFQSVTHRPLAG